MILCKYQKLSTAALLPHLDVLRTVNMAIRRKALKIKLSEGFNPHELIFFIQPPPVGTASMSEYFCVDSPEDAKVFMEKLNASLPQGIKILTAVNADKNPGFAAASYAAEYEVMLEKAVKLPDFKTVLAFSQYEISFMQKGQTVTKDVRNLIFDLQGAKSSYSFILACGNQNLRADRLMKHFLNLAGAPDTYFTVTKKRQLGKELIDFDKLFFMV